MQRLSLFILLALACASAQGEEAFDFAAGSQRTLWTHHPVVGDPSFDTFERNAANPIHRGSLPYEWPVNGFLFADPQSGHWYLFIGEYLKGYEHNDQTPSRSIVYSSADKGSTWTLHGPVFPDTPHTFAGETSPLFHAPDVAVTYAEGRYHMVFDWSTQSTTWQNIVNPGPDANSGAAYAWADKPEGPYHITEEPLVTTRDQDPALGKYKRTYASSLIKRENDWLLLTLTDSQQYFGWGYYALTSTKPDGPYSESVLVLHPQRPEYHPTLLEFHPAFAYEGYVYAPATSVALNRNYQALFRAPLEEAEDPAAWSIVYAGGMWHADPVEWEHYGIWGQTFSGFVDEEGVFNVMFPSRDANGMGTINIASRPWDKPFRDRGFVLSGHQGPSLSLVTRPVTPRVMRMEAETSGSVTMLWGAVMPLGADRPRSDATLHPQTLTRYSGVELDNQTWRLVRVDAAGAREVIAEGALDNANRHAVDLRWPQPDQATLALDNAEVWQGPLDKAQGAVGLLTNPHSWARVSEFAVTGEYSSGAIAYLYTDALLGAAQNMEDWEAVESPAFRFGSGVISKGPQCAAKWNFDGTGFSLYAPRGPEYGRARLVLNGKPLAELNFYSERSQNSSVIYASPPLDPAQYGLSLEPVEGRIPLDSVDSLN